MQFWFSDIRIVCLGVIGCTLQLFFISQKEKLNYIGKIIYYIVPLFTFIISIGIWTLVWSKYDGTWSNIQQGIITVFAGLIGAIGVFVTVAVNYENHEQNRNIQSEIERKRRKTEQKIENTRRDNETIKDLNERLHEILKNRHDSDDGVRASSYFQLAGLYKDWGLLGKNSKIIEAQRKVQQKNILKLIFGTVSQTEEQEQKKNARSFLEIRTLNSVIADIFPKVSDTDEYKESFEPFDLQYADLSGLTFDEVFFPDRSILSHADFICSSLQGVNLQCARLQGVNLQNAELWRADLQDADLQDADLLCADLQGANLRGANFQNTELLLADLPYANLQDANLWRANLQNAKLWNADLWNAKLWNADLQGADLQNAKLQNAKLQGADLQSADLQSADLQDADLQNAKLQGADLQSADLQGADLQSADLQDADLQSADLQDANLYGTAERLSSEQLAQAQNIESVETREWDWDFYEYGEEDRALKNLIQEALKIQEVRKNNPPQNS
ncbi:pentapeptide repeat-containing protein [Rothia sp. CCM 9418]|uniref:pentapeptide repeat-containing protein n=1 Tax=Rothia sp. CCM 9418 TaxID=3402661 RepID=UPI003AE60508